LINVVMGLLPPSPPFATCMGTFKIIAINNQKYRKEALF
jgi:hypothetical protein